MRKKQLELFEKLGEEDIPIIKIDDKAYTPKEIYEKKRRTVPTLSLEPDWDLLQERLEAKYRMNKLMTFYTLNNEKVTPEKQIEEVRNRTAKGYKYMLSELGLLEYLLAHE